MDTVNYSQFILAFLLVIGMIGVMAVLMRRYADPGKFYAGAGRQQGARLRVIETRLLDARRRLVLVERDRRQHLLLLAEGRELLVESFDTPSQGEVQREE